LKANKRLVFFGLLAWRAIESWRRKGAEKKTLGEKTHPQNAKSFLPLVLHRHATITSTLRRGNFPRKEGWLGTGFK